MNNLEKVDRRTLLKTEKIAYGIKGNKLKFIGEYYTNITFKVKTLKLKGFVMNRTQNLFGMNWIESFDLLNQPINSFCSSVSNNSNRAEKLKKELMIKFHETFSGGLGRSTKAKATTKILMPLFKTEKKSTFCSRSLHWQSTWPLRTNRRVDQNRL